MVALVNGLYLLLTCLRVALEEPAKRVVAKVPGKRLVRLTRQPLFCGAVESMPLCGVCNERGGVSGVDRMMTLWAQEAQPLTFTLFHWGFPLFEGSAHFHSCSWAGLAGDVA